MSRHILITGAAGFIGYSLAARLLQQGEQVLGIDNLNDYYDVQLKQARLARLQAFDGFRFAQIDVADSAALSNAFQSQHFDVVVHLAAQAGVRYSIENPAAYVQANLVGFANMLECARHGNVGHLVFASTSSVYGANTTLPFAEDQTTSHPVSFYAATKKANEVMAHSYAHLYRLPCTGLRFFTVYGPWGRPDMALFKFTRSILSGERIPVFNRGEMVRDFTYIDDIVDGVIRSMDAVAAPSPHWNSDAPDPGSSNAPWRVFNIGNNRPVKLLRYIELLEQSLGRKAELELLPMQAGDVPATVADVSRLQQATGYAPVTPVEVGVENFVRWYREYYRV